MPIAAPCSSLPYALFEALETSLRMLRCAGSAWREAQLHADAAQLRALEGNRAFAEAHIEQSLSMFSTLTSEHHPLRVRAQLLQRAILEIFGKMESVKEEDDGDSGRAAWVDDPAADEGAGGGDGGARTRRKGKRRRRG